MKGMNARHAVLLVALCACGLKRPIDRERIARQATTDLTGVTMDHRDKWTRPPPAEICEIGAKKYCGGSPLYLPRPQGSYPNEPLYIRCVRGTNGHAIWNNTECNTPLVVAFDASPVEFTRPAATFAIGISERTEWVSANSPWVALDRDGSGCIESARELFAGFGALAELDSNDDGVIDARDPAFAELVLWSDRDQDKRCVPNELTPLADRVRSLPLGYRRNERPERASYEGETATLANGARLVDVHLAALP
jgi:hypothetical protein